MFNQKWWLALAICAGLAVAFVSLFAQPLSVQADGTEQLGPPVGISIASGSSVVAAGTGLSTTLPATFDITVPTNSQIKQVLLYWSGGMDGDRLGSNTLTVNGQTVRGRAIGGPTFFFQRESGTVQLFFSAFRADITGLGLVQPGLNTISIESQPFDGEQDGAGIMVIYDDGSGNARIQIRDGIDLAYHGFTAERQVAVPQTFTFPALGTDRNARLAMFFGSVAPDEPRSSLFTITVDSNVAVTANDLLGSFDGAQWDTVNLDFVIPAGATSMTIEVKSPPDVQPDGASFSWISMGFFLLDPVSEIQIRKYTNNADADNRNGSDVPDIAPGDPVTWTYIVTNTGTVSFTQAQVTVTDSQPGITPLLDTSSDDGDAILSPGEAWLYRATDQAEDLTLPAAGVTVVQGCAENGVSRPTYLNIGRVTVPGAVDDNPSHYCNPPQPGITLQKQTNGADADGANDADVPVLTIGDTVTWTYIVTNTGNSIYPEASVVVTDSHQSVTPLLDRSSDDENDRLLSPGESWLYRATGIVADLANPPAAVTVVNGCQQVGGTARPTYENVGRVTVPDDTAQDPSHYCNPPAPTALEETDEPEQDRTFYIPFLVR